MLSFDEVASLSGKALGLPSISKLAKPLFFFVDILEKMRQLENSDSQSENT